MSNIAVLLRRYVKRVAALRAVAAELSAQVAAFLIQLTDKDTAIASLNATIADLTERLAVALSNDVADAQAIADAQQAAATAQQAAEAAQAELQAANAEREALSVKLEESNAAIAEAEAIVSEAEAELPPEDSESEEPVA